MKVNYEDIVDFLVKEFPGFKDTGEFKSYSDEDLKLRHIVMADFVRYITDRFKRNGEEDPELKKLFGFINEEYNNPKVIQNC